MSLFDDPEEIRGFIARYGRLWNESKLAGGEFTMSSEYAEGTGPAVWTLANHTLELAHAVLVLAPRAKLVTALPQIRLMIDCALTAAWLSVEPAAFGSLVHERSRQRKRTIESILETNVIGNLSTRDLDEAVDELQGNEPLQLAAGRNLEQRFKAMEGGHALYNTYRIASSFSHASIHLIDNYLRSMPKSKRAPLGVGIDPDGDVGSDAAWLGVAACMVMLALSAVDKIDAEHRLAAEVADGYEQLGITPTIALVAP